MDAEPTNIDEPGDPEAIGGEADTTPPEIRGCFSLASRALLGLGVGAGLGAVAFHITEQPIRDGAAVGALLGLVVWGAVGVFLWATFPYKPTK